MSYNKKKMEHTDTPPDRNNGKAGSHDKVQSRRNES
jgi:hypothetical protein